MSFKVGDEVVCLVSGDIGVVISIRKGTLAVIVSYGEYDEEYYTASGTWGDHTAEPAIRKLSKLEKALR